MKKEQQNFMEDISDDQNEQFLMKTHRKDKKKQINSTKSRRTANNSIEEEIINKKQLNQQKYLLIKNILHLMGLEKSKQVFEQQIQDFKKLKNPQQYSNNKSRCKKLTNNHINQKQLLHIISHSNNVQDILDTLQQFQPEGRNPMIKDSNIIDLKNTQKFIGMLFPVQQHASIPIYKNISIKCDKRMAVLLDTNDQDSFIVLDDDSYLHVLKSQTNKRQLKIQDKCKILLLRWLTKQLLLLINTNNKLYFYNSKLQLLRIYKLQINVIQSIHFQIIKYPSLQQQQDENKLYFKLFIINQKHKFIVNKVCINNQLPSFYKPQIYNCYHNFTNIEILRVEHKYSVGQKGKFTVDKEQDNTLNHQFYNKNIIVQHYYGLTTNRKEIVKFDTAVKEQGVIWNTNQSSRIQLMKSSSSRLFLILLISQKLSETFPLYNPQYLNKQSQMIKYQIVKLNSHGSIIENINLNFQNQQLYKEISCKKEIKINEIFILNPDWLSCFAVQNKIIYFSNQSGKLLYIHEVEDKNIKILSVKPNNTLIYTFDNHIKLLSLKEQEKNQYYINSKENNLRQRSGLMFRLSRYGIPETLLNLLRELRSNHIQLIQMP